MIAYAMNILNCLMMLLQVLVMINMARASCERIIEVSDEESSLKNGREPIYEMQNGASLSRRQRQLLSIACAAVANLPVMILRWKQLLRLILGQKCLFSKEWII